MTMLAHRFRKTLLGTALAAALVAGAAPANAVSIVFTDDGTVAGSAAERGFNIAKSFWEHVLTNDVTININISFSSFGDPDIIGGAQSNLYYIDIPSYQAYLGATGTTNLDAVKVLPTLTNGAVSVVTPGYVDEVNQLGVDTTKRVFDNDGSVNNQIIGLNSSVLKAIGLGADVGAGEADGDVTFSSDFAFDFDPTDGIDADKIDFVAVAIHEIGHILGFTSGVDDYDYIGGPNGPFADVYAGEPLNDYIVGQVLDLFRYAQSNDGAELNWAPGDDGYFSIDGGQTAFLDGYFSTGEYNGDGRQASHWKDASGNLQLGIMDPTVAFGQMGVVRALDLAALDAIGWNTNVDVLAKPNWSYTTAQAAVPEAATWAQMIIGFGFIGGTLRRFGGRRKTAIA